MSTVKVYLEPSRRALILARVAAVCIALVIVEDDEAWYWQFGQFLAGFYWIYYGAIYHAMALCGELPEPQKTPLDTGRGSEV